ncbi:MAG: hypothetical protein R2873_05680 [Caldilineaceae bacterium]
MAEPETDQRSWRDETLNRCASTVSSVNAAGESVRRRQDHAQRHLACAHSLHG